MTDKTELTAKEFLEVVSNYDGEDYDNIKQLAHIAFDGEGLFNFCQDFYKKGYMKSQLESKDKTETR